MNRKLMTNLFIGMMALQGRNQKFWFGGQNYNTLVKKIKKFKIHMYTCVYTDTHIYIYIYIYI
jgi:hypothetical protein